MDKNDSIKYYIVSSEGEFIRDVSLDENIYSVSTSPYKKEFKRLQTGFIKLNEVAYSQLKCNKNYLSDLLPCVCNLTGKLVYDNNKTVKGPMGIAKICKINKNTATKFVRELIEEDVIHKKEDGYVFNPFIALRGQKCTMELFNEFQQSKWRYINSKE